MSNPRTGGAIGYKRIFLNELQQFVYTTQDRKLRRKYEIIFGKCHREDMEFPLKILKSVETPTKKIRELMLVYECYMGIRLQKTTFNMLNI